MSVLIYSPHWPKLAAVLVGIAIVAFGGAVYVVSARFTSIADPFVRYALTFITVQAAILSSIVVGLIFGKKLALHRSRISSMRMNSLKELLARYVAGEQVGSELLRTSRLRPKEFHEAVAGSLHILKGSARRLVESLLQESDSYSSLLHQVSSRDPTRALKAISLLQTMDTREAEAAIEGALSHPAPIVRVSAQIAVLSGHNEAAQRKVLEAIPNFDFWHRVVVFHQISGDSPVLTEFLSNAFRSERDETILAALEFVLSRQRLISLAEPRHLARSPNTEIRIKYFKALPFFCPDSGTPNLVRLGLADSDWRVRAMAARATGQLRLGELATDLLEIAKTAQVPAETGHAVRALAAIGGEAWKAVQSLSRSGSEMTHRIITEVVEKEMLGGMETAR
jgi:HEAT repeat protein